MTIDTSLLLPQDPNSVLDSNNPTLNRTTMGKVYNFNSAGVVLSEHQHGANDTHVTIVLSGSLTMTENGVDRTIVAGDVVDLGTEPHSFVSLCPAQIINITKTGVSLQSLSDLIRQINSTISHLYTRIDNLNYALETQVPTNADLSNAISTLHASISDLKALIDS